MWRTRAMHSRKVAQEKERLAATGGGILAFALIVTAVMVLVR